MWIETRRSILRNHLVPPRLSWHCPLYRAAYSTYTLSTLTCFLPEVTDRCTNTTVMISARCACNSAAARRLALCSGRSAMAAGTSGKAGSGTALLQLTHRSLRTRSSPYHLSSTKSSKRIAQLRRQQQASTLSGDKLVPPRTTTTIAPGGKAAASTKNKAVAAWLFGTAGAVAVMVTVGGITRMTKSGLSMTDWKIQGSLPPSSEVTQEITTVGCVGS